MSCGSEILTALHICSRVSQRKSRCKTNSNFWIDAKSNNWTWNSRGKHLTYSSLCD